jgi:spoIIIJ-associated protein
VIHIALRNEHELRSESAGTGPFRHVVIYPAGMASLPDLPPPPPQERYRERSSPDRERRPDRGGNRRPPPRGRR